MIVFIINVIFILMSSSLMILNSIHSLYPSSDPVFLSLIGATSSTIGRYVLTYIGHISRKFISESRKTSLESIKSYLENKKFKYIIISLIFSLTPLPSNMLFIAAGIMKSRNWGLFIGFWIGRCISYFIMIHFSHIIFKPFIEIFSSQLLGILLIDLFGVLSIILFACIDWQKLLIEKKIRFIKPKMR